MNFPQPSPGLSIICKKCLLLSLIIFSLALPAGKSWGQTDSIKPGAEQMAGYLPLLKGKSVAVFANQTSLIGQTHLVDTLLRSGIRIRRIFSPEHGFRGTADAGESIKSQQDPATGIEVISLYGNKLKPSAEDLRDIDVLVLDIQDVGVRFYTFISSLQLFLESAIENNKPMILLDRPNPNGFYVDGPVLDTAFRSFVGMQPVPVVYGLTMGEYATLLLGEKWIRAENREAGWAVLRKQAEPDHLPALHGFKLFVVPNLNYSHKSRYKLKVKPSPNLPNMQAIYLYPSLCFFEGTVVSLGRGTDKPFQQFGHPDFPKDLYHFQPVPTAGAKNPPLVNQVCYGYDLSGISPPGESKGRISLQWLLKAYSLYPDKKNFFLPSRFFSKLAGNATLMEQIQSGQSEQAIRKSWKPGLEKFKKIRKKYLLYKDFE